MNESSAAAQSAVCPPLWRRLAAMLYEAFLLFALFVPTLALMLLIGALLGAETRQFQGWAGALFTLLPFSVWGIYFVWCWHGGGSTLAMKAWKLRIVDTDGNKPSLHRALGRYLCALLVFAPVLIGLLLMRQHAHEWRTWALLVPACISLLWAFIDRDKQFLHDRLAGTRLLKAVESRGSRVESG